MKQVPFGTTGRSVSAVGLGGEGVLRTYGRLDEAQTVIRQAIEMGVTYFDSARVYSDSEIYLGSIWGENPDVRKSIFQTSKSASRDRDGALADLEGSLKRLQTDYLDLWQIHDVRTMADIEAISRPGGALEAFVEAREKGTVRFIGVTGHHDPEVLTRAVQEWPVDSVLLPVNPIEEIIGGFLTSTLNAAKEKNIGVVGMKVVGGSHYILPKLGITADLLIRYANSIDITLPIIGCSNPDEVKTMVDATETMVPLTLKERAQIMSRLQPYASRLAFYRGTR